MRKWWTNRGFQYQTQEFWDPTFSKNSTPAFLFFINPAQLYGELSPSNGSNMSME